MVLRQMTEEDPSHKAPTQQASKTAVHTATGLAELNFTGALFWKVGSIFAE